MTYKSIFVEFRFDSDEFHPDKITPELVERQIKAKGLVNRGVSITVSDRAIGCPKV